MSAHSDPLLAKRKTRAPIGCVSERYFCLACMAELPEEAAPYLMPLVEGDDAGVPYNCSKCGKALTPA